eukprot:CAMPEP_0174913334 /NCGR_PEP_ID=MMETSP0167-20121228/80249_1 /TAXON_ID=38298 /ORGANISM="Rhodella maculata, Strain CCMP736" /LENGTH=206 /DNA_ID=CAMNT_0016158047 /DNA_START=1219 /DNA_END=1840 /DNA_ORIENTATION=-
MKIVVCILPHLGSAVIPGFYTLFLRQRVQARAAATPTPQPNEIHSTGAHFCAPGSLKEAPGSENASRLVVLRRATLETFSRIHLVWVKLSWGSRILRATLSIVCDTFIAYANRWQVQGGAEKEEGGGRGGAQGGGSRIEGVARGGGDEAEQEMVRRRRFGLSHVVSRPAVPVQQWDVMCCSVADRYCALGVLRKSKLSRSWPSGRH